MHKPHQQTRDPAPQAGNPALWVKPDPWRIRTICLKLKIRSDVILQRTRHLPRRTFFSVTFCFGRFRPKLRRRAGQICGALDRKSTRLNSSHLVISYAVFCLKKKKITTITFAYSLPTPSHTPALI